jgi:hypothetical protein
MTRTLPPRADLHHLRKEAKKLHAKLKRQAPQASLADAQFILAAEYGFKSWGRLKTAVEDQASERWAARLQAQESFQPFPVLVEAAPTPSSHRIWFRYEEDEPDMPLAPEVALVHIGFILLALLTALTMALR